MFRRRKPNDPAPGPATDTHGSTEPAKTDGTPLAADGLAESTKGPAMSSPTPKPPSAGFVPEIPRRAVEIPGAPVRRPSPRPTQESKRLVVGKDISLAGEITACDSLVVEGTVEATLENSQSLEVAEGGHFKGRVLIEEAIIGGLFDGDLTARNKLTVKATGVITGTVRFARMEVELGGVLKGDVAPLSEGDDV